MDEFNEMLLISFKAQCDYISKRIHNTKDKEDFKKSMNYFICIIKGISCLIDWDHQSRGYKMVLDIYKETHDLLKVRFVIGKSTEYAVEKL
jgi:hypothetical protein